MGFRLSYIALEAYRGFRRNALLATSMVIIVAISLTLLGVALLAGRQVDLYGGYWADKIEVSVFLTDDITQPQRDEIQSKLQDANVNGVPVVQRIYHETKEQAYQRFKEQFKDSPEIIRNVSQNAMPESFRIKLRDPEQFKQVHDLFCSNRFDANGREVCPNPGVDQVVDQRKLVERLFAVLRLLRNSFLVLAAVLGLAAVVLIAVTVRVAAFARRKETQIMKLVGASNTYIRLPFLAEGVFAGILGALVAFGFLRVGMYYIGKVRNELPIFEQSRLVGMRDLWSTWSILLILGMLVSGLASLIALRKYVRV